MRKPDSLKALLLQTVPGLADNPNQLALFVNEGEIVGGGGASLSFEYRFSVNLVFESFPRRFGTDAIAIPILAWLSENQPDLLNKPEAKPFKFEAELLDDDTMDVSITIDLTEAVLVSVKEGGGYGVSHPVQVSPISPLADVFAGVPKGVVLWQLFLRNELIAQTDDPNFHP